LEVIKMFSILLKAILFALGFQASRQPGTSSTTTLSHPMAPLFGAELAIEKNEGIHAPAPIVGAGQLCRIVAYGVID
jgi:hypothetical protein